MSGSNVSRLLTDCDLRILFSGRSVDLPGYKRIDVEYAAALVFPESGSNVDTFMPGARIYEYRRSL